MVTHGQIYFETATPTPRASGGSPRGGDRHGTNHTPLRAELSELTFSIPNNRGDWSSSGNRSLEGSGKTLRQIYFQVELGRIHLCT